MENVNKQLLDAVDLLKKHQLWINKLPVPTAGATHQMMNVVGKSIGILEAIAAAEQAQQAAPVAYDRALIIEMLNRYCECVDARTHESGKVISQMDLLARAAQQPAVAVAVPDAAVGKLRMLLAACNRIEEEAEELEGPDGLVMGIAMDYWHEFAETLTAARKALAASQHAAAPLSRALADIAAERRRQMEVEGWTPEHDDKYGMYALAAAAGCYAMYTLAYPAGDPPRGWPWDASWWKPSDDPRRNWVKAGALIAAEIERIDRAAQKGGA